MRALLLVPFLLAACLPRGGEADTSAWASDLAPPTIVSLTHTCDPDAGRWRFEVGTAAWARDAVLLWTVDGTYLERHTGFRSITAAPDGSSDVLRNDVSILTDFRAARDGQTAFPCTVTPSWLLWTRDLDGEVADCVASGPAPELVQGRPNTPDCPRIWDDTPADTDTPAG